MKTNDLNVQLLLTGNEIMSGDTVDSNSALIARRLGDYVGAQLKRSIHRSLLNIRSKYF